MSVDWFTVGAQALNLLILLWLMKLFLYKPILKAIDEREKRIAAELASAEADKTAAKKQKEEYDQKNGELNRQSASFLKKARDEAQTEKLRLLDEAKEAALAFSVKRQKALATEETTLRKEVTKRIQDESIALARKALTDLAGASLEGQVVLAFIQRLRDLDPDQKKDLASELKDESDEINLRTAFDLSPQLRTDTELAIKEIIGPRSKVRFESSPELISGIELVVQGQKVAWNIGDYLSSMTEILEGLIKEQDQ